ncbi:hypothetical protein B0T18DRAFT_206860 [Schizothecium vesticola]|uniref:Uncharacterized protein n=1 Tax=Schizothecium vesticola TaxID=314040 RepID=A0AA40JYU8_9PEZI|nr:hypothetical protein B0T18DRAFT_206860 [Schizothecium vesticola]
MPYSDDLYSAWDEDESDTEATISDGLNHSGSGLRGDTGPASHALGTGGDDEVEDALSPTNGYFQSTQTSSSSTASALEPTTSSNVPRIPNVWVQDPSLAPNSTTESKAQEAAREGTTNAQRPSEPLRQSTPNTASPTIYRHPEPASPLSSPGPDAYHQQSSSTHAPSGPWPTTSYTPYAPQRLAYGPGPSSIPAEAPPAYTPSPTTSSPTVNGNVSTNYSTFSPAPVAPNTVAPMGGHEEFQGLFSHEPQSMGGSAVEPQHGSLPWYGQARRKLTARRTGKSIIVAGLLLFLICGFLRAAFDAGQDQDHSYPPRKKPYQKEPVHLDPPTDPDHPPPMETPGLSPNFPWSDRLCKRAQISRGTREFDISFTPDKALTIIQDVAKGEHHGSSVSVQGSVVLRQAYPDSPGPSVVIETVVNHETLDVSIHWDATEQSLTVTVPRDTPWDETFSRPCLSVSITVYVPESATLKTLSISTIHLDISLLDNLSLSLLTSTTLSSTVGAITSASTGHSLPLLVNLTHPPPPSPSAPPFSPRTPSPPPSTAPGPSPPTSPSPPSPAPSASSSPPSPTPAPQPSP